MCLLRPAFNFLHYDISMERTTYPREVLPCLYMPRVLEKHIYVPLIKSYNAFPLDTGSRCGTLSSYRIIWIGVTKGRDIDCGGGNLGHLIAAC